MALIQEFKTILASVGAAGGVHYVHNQGQPPLFPYILFTRISSPINTSLRGESDLQNTVFQVDVFAKKVADADTISKSVSTALLEWQKPVVRTDVRDSFEDAINVYRVSQDFSVWSTS